MDASSHAAIMKCPWQWRPPFLDDKLASRKRQVGDGFFYDPVDPSFVDHLLPAHAKRFCARGDDADDEKARVAREIARLASDQEALRAASRVYDALLLRVAEARDAAAAADADDLLASPKSVASPGPPSEDELADEDELDRELELVSDNLHDELFAEDLDFPHD